MEKKYVVLSDFMNEGEKEDTLVNVFSDHITALNYYEVRIAEEMESDWYQHYINHGAEICEHTDATQENLEWTCYAENDNFLIIRLITKIENQEG